jgi:O-antigen ligase
MSVNENKKRDYNSLGSAKKNDGRQDHEPTTLKPANKSEHPDGKKVDSNRQNLVNYNREQKLVSPDTAVGKVKPKIAVEPGVHPSEITADANNKSEVTPLQSTESEINVRSDVENYSEILKLKKEEKKEEQDLKLLSNESWVIRNGHFLTYVGLYCFSILVFFRPYELISGLGFLSATAFYFALATLLIFFPTQLATDGSLTTLSTEVKCILLITAIALLTIPIAKDPAMAWEEFNDSFIKAVVMFVVMVNVLRTRRRLTGIIWLSLAMGLVLSYMAVGMYLRGEITVEGYRVGLTDIGGMFGNPNEMALHLVMMTPLAVALGLAAKKQVMKYLYFIMAGLFVAATVVTYSRGGFLGLLALSAVLIWKLGKKQKLKILAISAVLFVIFILLAPGEYAQRIFSIFDSSLDAVGSSNQRTDLLKRSILVTLRNPWGIGIGNFPIVGYFNLGTHNTYTQISSELGITGLLAYLIFLISPFRKLGAIERRLFAKDETGWFYYLAIGLQASIVGFMVSSFFAAVAYNWFVYYLIAYAVAFRRVYTIEKGLAEEDTKADSLAKDLFGWQIRST